MSDPLLCPKCSCSIAPLQKPGTDHVVCPECGCEFKVDAPGAAAPPESSTPQVDYVRVAARQQGMLIALLISLAFGVVVIAGIQTGQWQARRSGPPPALIAFLLGWLLTGAICHILFLMLSIELRVVGLWLAATGIGVIIAIAALGGALPAEPAGMLTTLVNVTMVLIVNGMATSRLRGVGVQVGLFGADRKKVLEALAQDRASTAKKTGMATAAILLSLFGLLFMPIEFLAIALGITALVRIHSDPACYGGRKRAITAVAVSSVAILLFAVLMVVQQVGKAGHLDGIFAQHREAVQSDPDDPHAHNTLAMLLTMNGDLDGGIEHCREALSLDPDNADANYIIGNAMLCKGDLDGAIEHYREALRIDPDNADVHNDLAVAFMRKGNFDGAIKHYREALQIDPDVVTFYSNLALALAKKGDLDGAIEHAREAARLYPEDAFAQGALGVVLCVRGDSGAGRRHLNKALELDPGLAITHYNLACCLALEKEAAAAIEALAKAIDLDERLRKYARTDEDFDAIRNAHAFRKLVHDE